MDRKLSLIKSEEKTHEKRVFPRFPIGLMIFKDQAHAMSFEVKDISLTGMQLEFKDGSCPYKLGDSVKGTLHWRSDEMVLNSLVQWQRDNRLGLKFPEDDNSVDTLKSFLSLDNIVSHIRAIHENPIGIEMPNGLKYWLKADGVLEIFVWEAPRSGISRFQILFMENFLEWTEGVGLRTGKVLTQRNLETPLTLEDEMVFEADEAVDDEKIHLGKRIFGAIDPEHIHHADREFLLYKLKGHKTVGFSPA